MVVNTATEYEVRSTVVPREFNNTKDPGRSLAYVVQRRDEDRKRQSKEINSPKLMRGARVYIGVRTRMVKAGC